jgi:predicted MPP superfamily phosphohydrolase
MGVFSIALSFFIVLLPLALLFKKKRHYFVYLGLFLTVVMIFPALYNQLRKPKIVKLHISSFKIPEELSPFKIVQLSDIHLGRLTSKEWLKGIVKEVNALKPDVIALTGDMVTETVNLDEFYPILGKLESKYGTFAVTGNHEFYVNFQHVENFCDKSFITLLKNSRTTLTKYFEIMGVNDDTAKRFGLEGAEVESTLERLDDKKFNLFLSHKPLHFKKASKMGVDLQLSGHTHAGQLPPFTPLIHLVYKYSHGLYSFEDSKIYTSSGVGSFGPAMRLFSRPEIVSISIENP